MKDDQLYLIHINECVERIEQYTVDGKDVFYSDKKTQDAVLRNLQIMAESTQRLSIGFKEAHPEVDWVGISGFRNILVHNYLGVNIKRVWEILERDLPSLKRKLTGLINGGSER